MATQAKAWGTQNATDSLKPMTIERRAPGSRSTQELVPSSVMMFGFGASTHCPRSPNRPPAQPPSVIARSPAAQARRAARTGRSRSGIERVQPSPSGSTEGQNISSRRSAAASRTASGSAYVPTSMETR